MLEFDIGDVVAGRYEIKKVLGAGGMGKVYRARQVDLGRDVALKIPSAAVLENPDVMARFAREARTVARLTHDNIVQVYEYYHEEDLAFIAMEFVEGDDFKNLISKTVPGLTVGDMAKIIQLSCEGMEHAHEFGIVHRDIKPHNVMVARLPRGRWRVKVMDFGIAHIDAAAQFTEMDGGQLTQTGQALGTPSYMSPEQIRGTGVSHLSDIYSMGCVIYYAFTRQTVFTGSGLTVAVAHLNERPPSLRGRVPGLPAELDQLILQCLEKDPARRPQHATEIGDRILKILHNYEKTSMEEVWKQSLQAPDATIPIIASPTNPSQAGTGGNLVQAPTQDSIAMTGADPAAGETIAGQGLSGERIPSIAGSAGAPPASPDDPTLAGGTSVTGQPEAATPATTAPSTSGTVALGKGRMPMIIGAVAGVCLLVGVLGAIGIRALRGGAEETTPAVIASNHDNEVPTIPEAENGDTEVAIVRPDVPLPDREVVPTPVPVEVTPTPRPTPTATPTPTPDPREVRRESIQRRLTELNRRGERSQDFVTEVRTWGFIMELLDDEDDSEFRQMILRQADEVATRIVRNPTLVSVGGGRFTMGNNQGPDDERPERNVYVSDYQIGKFEVTALEFATFLNADLDRGRTLYFPTENTTIHFDEELERFVPRPGFALHPANRVSWVAADAYTRWLSEETGRNYRLPTEAEWERAARGTAQYRYPWGDDTASSSYANFNASETMEVNQLDAGTGFTDMYHLAGNVAEWCLDWFDRDYYQSGDDRDPRGPIISQPGPRDRRVHRGGSFLSTTPTDLVSSRRGRARPEELDSGLGFRLVLADS